MSHFKQNIEKKKKNSFYSNLNKTQLYNNYIKNEENKNKKLEYFHEMKTNLEINNDKNVII